MCGNWGLLALGEFAARARRNGEAFPEGLERLLREMLTVVEMRGAQAGGLHLVFGGVQGVQACRVRALKPKRGNLGAVLFRGLRRNLWRQSLLKGGPCRRAPRGPVLAQGHSRFGTSSAPAARETHPHQWSPSTRCTFWSWEPARGWVRRHARYTLTVTHNGDFDAWRPYRDTMVDVGAMGLWLDRVLGVRNGATGDSAKIAGTLELLVCQGIWLHAVRLAYHLHVACHVEQASGWMPLHASAPHAVPDRATLQAWADVLDDEFAQQLVPQGGVLGPRQPLSADSSEFRNFVTAAAYALKNGPTSKTLQRWIPAGKVERFVHAAAEAFRDNDLLATTTAFLRRAEGTFGLTVSATLWPQTVVLAARGQPMSVAFGGTAPSGGSAAAFWSSERAALSPLATDGTGAKGLLQARLDLDDQWGEVLQLSACTSPGSLPQEDTAADTRFPLRLSTDGKDETAGQGGAGLEVCGLQFGDKPATDETWAPTLMTPDSFRSRLTWLASEQDPSKASQEVLESSRDVVARDLGQLPHTLHEIDLCWGDKHSLNSKSASHFGELLLGVLAESSGESPPGECCGAGELAERPQGRGIDLLVFGVESSLWLAQQFCADLTRLFPGLHAVAMSSNVALGLLQDGPGYVEPYNWVYSQGSFQVTRRTVGLAVSHSGTTYPTVWAARCLRERTEHVFSLASSFDCLLAVSIGQAPDQPFTRRLFSSLAGVRPAEAATVATIAMHHTLSHLLLRCAAMATGARLPSLQNISRSGIVDGTAREPPEQQTSAAGDESQERTACACAAPAAAVQDMHRLLLTLYWGASAACGTDSKGRRLDPDLCSIHSQLRLAGRRWSHHITESYWATFLPAAYVLVTVAGGIPPVTSLGTLLADAFDASSELQMGLLWLFRSLDSLIYVFLGILVAMTHRACTHRRVWARFSSRTLLVVESTVNYKLLRAYASKLVALSWRFATISVVGQNGTDHFVHEYTHKAQSDVLVALGLPDGRMHTAASAEACVLMSAQQAKFIKRLGKGIEILSLGHNPYRRPGLCTGSLTLPTRRPLSAGEWVLLRDQLAPCGQGSGSHGLPPSAVAQRWSDLLVRQMDALGMPGLRMSWEELTELLGTEERLDFRTAHKLLHSLLDKQRLEVQAEAAPLGLERFLEDYLSQLPGRTTVFVHSPAKEFMSPQKWWQQSGNLDRTSNRCSVCSLNSSGSDMPTPTSGASGLMRLVESEGLNSAEGFREVFSRQLVSGGYGRFATPGKQGPSPSKMASAASPGKAERQLKAQFARDQVLEKDEFLAIVHGDELKNWVRTARHRWSSIRKLRGLLVSLADECSLRRQHAMMAVFSGGATMGHILLAWRRQATANRSPVSAKPTRATRNDQLGTVFERALQDRALQRLRASADLAEVDAMAPSKDARFLGQHLLDEGLSEAQVLRGVEPTERFYETRVGGAERLIAWYVLFHAMAEPSSRLPFLGFELGKTESRLRVASTPAPVPVLAAHAGRGAGDDRAVPVGLDDSDGMQPVSRNGSGEGHYVVHV